MQIANTQGSIEPPGGIKPAYDIARLRTAIDQSIAANNDMPNSAALLAIRISNMTKIRELFGDQAAKIVMPEIEKRLKKVLRGTDVLGQLSEGHFAVVLTRCPPEEIPTAGKRFLAAATGARVYIIDGAVEVTISITGIAFPDEGLTSDAVIARAEAGSDVIEFDEPTETQRRISAERILWA